MKFHFVKYQGTGNDFIMLDNRNGSIQLKTDQIVKICDRKFGIGSDGVILLEDTGFADFYMNFYNPDGSQSFCGNGSRCAVRFAQSLGLVSTRGEFKAIDTNHPFDSDHAVVSIKMRNVQEVEENGADYVIHTGSPHYIIYCEDIDQIDIVAEAHKIRYNPRFSQEGINVNFVVVKNGVMHIRTYERGVENETLSCGTGVTAAALSYAVQYPGSESLKVITRGGELEVKFKQISHGEFENIWLCGPAEVVFDGEIEIS